MSSTLELKETKISQLPRKYFLQKAREDLLGCIREVSGKFRWCASSRRAMVNLLRKAILAAEQKGYDDELFVTYHDIYALMRGWYFEDTLKSIVSTTLLEIRKDIIERQESVPAKLSEEKQILKESLASVREAHGLLKQVLAEKTEIMKILSDDNGKLRQRNKQLKQSLAKEKKISAGLRKELERASVSEASSEKDLSGFSSLDSNYSSCLLGGSSASSPVRHFSKNGNLT